MMWSRLYLFYILSCVCVAVHAKSVKPNIIVIIADDVGWNDMSFHGSDQIKTPNLAALAYHGVILGRHYTQQVCTPSRAAFLSGQYPIRLGYQGYPLGLGLRKSLPDGMITLPKCLKDLGYNTHLIGKWHLGHGRKVDTPLGHGYDTHYGYWNGYMGYFDHSIGSMNKYNGTDLHDQYAPVMDQYGQYATDMFTARAQEIIKNHDEKNPLYLVVSHLAGHTGKTVDNIETELEVHNITYTNEKYAYIDNVYRRMYTEILERMDDSVGQIVESLAKRDMLENSVIVYFSDNGAPTYGLHANNGSNYPLRGIKMTMFEGGIRTPSIIFSPLIKNKGRVYNKLFHITDWVPTLLKAAGGDLKKLGKIDGIDQWSTLAKDHWWSHPRQEMLVDIDPKFHYSAYIGYNGRYKLINNSNFDFDYSGDPGFTSPLDEHFQEVKTSTTNRILETVTGDSLTSKQVKTLRDKVKINCNAPQSTNQKEIKSCDGFCLFDLAKDPCEFNNVAGLHRDIVQELWMKIQQLAAVAKPKPVLDFDPKADPQFCNQTWFNWLDQDGCWFNITH